MAKQGQIGFYGVLGVSSTKEEVDAAVRNLSPGLFPGAFCRIFPDPTNDDYCYVMHSDGVGTKVAVAYLMQKIGFDSDAWKKLPQDGLVMNLDDMACVGAVDGPFYISSSLGRNACQTNQLNPESKVISGKIVNDLIAGAQEFCARLTGLGIPCILTGGETADVGDLVRTAVVDYTVFCRMKRDGVIDPLNRIALGDVIVGFSSTGQAKWEDEPNSGLGSNGFTAARHGLLSPCYRVFTETYAPETNQSLIYRGKYKLNDRLPGDSRFTIGSALISPTRTYLPLIYHILHMAPGTVHAFIHNTGGGQTKIKKFGGPGLRYRKNNLFPMPPIFAAIQESSGLSHEEMYKIFNMGHRLEAIVLQRWASSLIRISKNCGIDAQIIGAVEKNEDPHSNSVVIKTKHGTFNY